MNGDACCPSLLQAPDAAQVALDWLCGQLDFLVTSPQPLLPAGGGGAAAGSTSEQPGIFPRFLSGASRAPSTAVAEARASGERGRGGGGVSAGQGEGEGGGGLGLQRERERGRGGGVPVMCL